MLLLLLLLLLLLHPIAGLLCSSLHAACAAADSLHYRSRPALHYRLHEARVSNSGGRRKADAP